MAKGKTLTQADVNLLSKTFLTKKDANSFATKDDLKLFATKDDLKNLRSDVKKLLTAQDIRNWAKMAELEEKFEKHVVKLKSDFLDEIDPILKEVTTAREERPLIENRLEILEDIHPEGKHAVAS